MNEPQTNNYEFGEFRVDAVKRLLLREGGEIIPLTPKVFELLLYLVRNTGRTLEKNELMREIWTDTIVEESNLSQNVSILRRILGEKRGEHRFIVTVPGHGYKFVSEVRRIEEGEKGRKGEGDLSEPPAVAGRLNAAELNISDEKLQIENQSDIRNLKSEINQAQKPKTEDQFAKDEGQRTKNEKPNRRWLVAISVLSILALGAAGFFLWRENGKSADAPVKTVAVLPFKPLVAENRDEALEMGMADTLIAKLGGNREIIVRPLSSVRRFGNLEQDAQSAGANSALRRFWTETFNVGAIKFASTCGWSARRTARLCGAARLTKSSPIFSSCRTRFQTRLRRLWLCA